MIPPACISDSGNPQIPQMVGAWTLVLSSQPYMEKYDPERKDATWGSGNYDPKFDVVRAPMTMLRSPVSIDQFTIGFVDVGETSGKLALAWDHEVATVGFKLAECCHPLPGDRIVGPEEAQQFFEHVTP